jgi:hypothetical protein
MELKICALYIKYEPTDDIRTLTEPNLNPLNMERPLLACYECKKSDLPRVVGIHS